VAHPRDRLLTRRPLLGATPRAASRVVERGCVKVASSTRVGLLLDAGSLSLRHARGTGSSAGRPSLQEALRRTVARARRLLRDHRRG